ncbi:MAG: hypothetical protein JXB47_05925 [Anaerolineae bacterium]|nr:hypothetical protein [Anaerolineae bacterium]
MKRLVSYTIGVLILFLFITSDASDLLEKLPQELGINPLVLPIAITSFVFLLGLPGLINSLRVYLGAPKRRERDVSYDQHPLSAAAQAIVDQLTPLGFTRLGETATDLPGHPGQITWYFMSADGTITTEVVSLAMLGKERGIVQFTTVFSDESVLETSYPIGDNLDYPDFYSRKNDESVAAAYEMHRRTAGELQIKHGAPRTVKSMTELLSWAALHRERHVRRKLRPPLMTQLKLSGWFLYTIGYMVVASIIMSQPGETSDAAALVIAVGAVLIIVLGLLVLKGTPILKFKEK